MVIEILAEKLETGERKTFYYSNLTAEIKEEPFEENIDIKGFTPKKENVRFVKLQLGLACNYSCAYCSQASHAVDLKPQTKDLNGFVEKLKKFAPKPERIELWGGEPLLYFKTIKKLVPLLKREFPGVDLSTITNGSLLTDEIVDFLVENQITTSISHDGPGQHIRGDDILETKRPQIERLMDGLLPLGRFSFNAVLTAENYKRNEIVSFFRNKFPNHQMPFNEMVFIDAYHEEGEKLLDITSEQHTEIRRYSWLEIRANAVLSSDVAAIQNYISMHGQKFFVSGQSCGMDTENRIAVDLDGNLITCQNVSSVAIADNGKSHKIGSLDSSEINTDAWTHWKDRPMCKSCLVLKTCKGSCMYLYGNQFNSSCDMMFTSHVPFFAIAFEIATGFVPIWSNTPVRSNIWEHEPIFTKKKVIPIKAA